MRCSLRRPNVSSWVPCSGPHARGLQFRQSFGLPMGPRNGRGSARSPSPPRAKARPLLWVEDLTQARVAAEALRASEERLDLAVAGTRSAIWETTFPSRRIWWSEEFYRMLGYPNGRGQEADDDIWQRHIHPEDVSRVVRAIAAYLYRGADGEVYEATYRMSRLDGSVIWVVAKGRRTLDDAGQPLRFNGIMLDVTAQKTAEHALRQAQQNLIQAEKMASLGSLVAGVAHEINTPVGNTLTAASHLFDKVADVKLLLDENRMRRSDLVAFFALLGETSRLMVTNCERAAELVQSFKQVAVDQTSGERRQYDMKGYIQEVLVSLRPQMRKTPHVVTLDCPDHLEMDSFPGALSQVLTNFLMNSIMHGYDGSRAGNILIRVSQPESGLVELVYADDGHGIPRENLRRIFDPFFTTRRGAGGSGLGLHIVFNIVTGTLRGTIDVQSAVGQGTRFTLQIPRHTPSEDARGDIS